MTATAADDLLEFAVSIKKPAAPCTICELPEHDAINEAKRRAPARKCGGNTVRKWLIARCGYTEDTAPTRQQIDHHFVRRHHEP